MEQYKYDFSVVMAVYNVERFLREAVDSLIHQTIGFDRIQLILVDDGSPDKSGAICNEYRAKYPENIIVIHKENGRQASARNAGLPHAQGKYVNFMDPDDTMDRDALERVFRFMEAHTGETHICCIPMCFFGDYTGGHLLNDKFESGERVIDLEQPENADCILLSASATFFVADAVRDNRFDTELYHAEDAKFNLGVLMERPRLGVVTGTKYNYRKHGGSTIDRRAGQRLSYIPYIRHFSQWALDEAERRFGKAPKYIQYTVMYDLQWKIKQAKIPDGVLSKEESVFYRKYLIDTICRIDDDIILGQRFLDDAYKAYIMGIKYSGSMQNRGG